MGKPWTQEEYDYLEDNWGLKSLQAIANHLNRSEAAINIKVFRLGLGAFLENGEYVTFNQLCLALGRTGGTGYMMKSWVEERGFPIKHKRVNNCKFKVVYLDEFWKWAEKNRTFIDFSKVEENIIGKEPEWVREQRKLDWDKKVKFRICPWTIIEDDELRHLLQQSKYTYDEISVKMHRTVGAIQRRCIDLNLSERPIKANNQTKWTAGDIEALELFIKQGMSYEIMAEKMSGKSSKAIRGKVYTLYGSENLDKIIRGEIDNQKHERQKTERNQRRRDEKVRAELMKKVITLLMIKRNSMEFSEYWQKEICMNWNDIKGCLAKEHDCDSCSEFIRIRPQYCVRCGTTIISRDKEQICQRCKDQRKKQAQRKYAIKSKKQGESTT
ncbi:MAG: hypothetical protein ACC608_09495 [Anaerofustis sp.]